jgi:hypothetical protein
MHIPIYVGLTQARKILEKMNILLSPRHMKRAAEMDANGKRKLPFFVDPIDGKLKIERGDLVNAYMKLQAEAKNNLRD